MSKSVLISIRPEWVELIASGKKTIEVRKTRPKLEPPFKCYIYCTKGKDLWLAGVIRKREAAKLNMKVVGEFICDHMDYFGVPFPAYMHQMDQKILHDSCLTYMDLHMYAGHRGLYAWHISDLKIYDEPKKLTVFWKWSDGTDDKRPCQNGKPCKYEVYDYAEDCQACGIDFDGENCPFLRVTKPPQSYCYVEDIAT